MAPICIVTRNRYRLLDITLRSLSASNLPDEQILIVFDAGSDSMVAKTYLYRSDVEVALHINWPENAKWRQSDLAPIKARPRGYGIAGKVRVIRFKGPPDVVNASCAAIQYMRETYGIENGLLLLQDDVVFNPDWYTRIIETENAYRPNYVPSIGLISGCWINAPTFANAPSPVHLSRGNPTAQCYYLTKSGIDAISHWLPQEHKRYAHFDDDLCSRMRQKATILLMRPAVCQHIGITSLVRPTRSWFYRGSCGRIDFTARGPFPLADDIRKFAA